MPVTTHSGKTRAMAGYCSFLREVFHRTFLRATNCLTVVGIHQLATRSMEDALRCFDAVLATHSTNVIALLGKVCAIISDTTARQTYNTRLLEQARILYARRQYPQALKIFQDVLRYNPECKPDPRIGIGLCFWALDQRPRAKAAWQRSLEVVRDFTFGYLDAHSHFEIA